MAVFTTRETPDYDISLRIQTSLGALEQFAWQKLFISLHDSLSHRPTALDDASALTNTIVVRLLPLSKTGLIKLSVVTKETTEVLANFDKAAATYYKAHHN